MVTSPFPTMHSVHENTGPCPTQPGKDFLSSEYTVSFESGPDWRVMAHGPGAAIELCEELEPDRTPVRATLRPEW